MTSDRKAKANRENARGSTGPRTAAGKARAANNALRHGLSLSILSDSGRAADLVASARNLVEEDAGEELLELATRIAAAQLDLVRVRQARIDMIAVALRGTEESAPSAPLERFIESLIKDDRQLMALDRYERRSISRRKNAIREFDAARGALTQPHF